MARCVVYQSYMQPSKVKGELPDVIYEFIANDSTIRWHYTFTQNIEDSYIFDDFELELAHEIAELWGMKVKKLDV